MKWSSVGVGHIKIVNSLQKFSLARQGWLVGLVTSNSWKFGWDNHFSGMFFVQTTSLGRHFTRFGFSFFTCFLFVFLTDLCVLVLLLYFSLLPIFMFLYFFFSSWALCVCAFSLFVFLTDLWESVRFLCFSFKLFFCVTVLFPRVSFWLIFVSLYFFPVCLSN